MHNHQEKTSILILGGTQMLGKNCVEQLLKKTSYDVMLSNRGITNKTVFSNLPHLKIDRNTGMRCSNLANFQYDIVIDFSCYNKNQFINTIRYIKYKKYVLISTKSVLEANPDKIRDSLYKKYVIDKCELEQYVLDNYAKNLTIIRPGAVYGHDDYTGRFEYRNNNFYWKNTNALASETQGCIFVDNLSKKIIDYLDNILKSDINETTIINIP